MKVLYGDDANVAAWVAARIPHANRFEKYTALGVIADNDAPVAGIVYHDYVPDYGTIQLSMAADSPKWAQREIIRQILAYPFIQLDVRKVWTATPLRNERAIKFNKGIGFKQEAVLAHHYGEDHAVICRMFRKQFEQLFKE